MPAKTSEHASRNDDSGLTMCGRDVTRVQMNEGFPDCKTCKRAIAVAISKMDAAAP